MNTNIKHCICLEQIGDNGNCPVHTPEYQPGPASLFASAAREDAAEISFPSLMEGYVGNNFIHKGDLIRARELGMDGLWAVSSSRYGQGKIEIARLNAHDVNKLAGFELVKNE